MVKKRTEAFWNVYHGSLSANQTLELNVSAAAFTASSWGNTSPDSSVFSVGAYADTNGESGAEYMAYCWAETPGLTRFDSYLGNSGRQTIQTGFRPSLVIIKSIDDGNWFMFDNARGTFNVLYANLDSKEADLGAIEFLEDGFQILFALPGVNVDNNTYIYAAFANPFDAAAAQRQLRREARQGGDNKTRHA